MTLQVVNLSKRFQDKWVLRDVSFDVADREVFGIVGRAGSGKTTLLRAIAGSIPTNGGSISSNAAAALILPSQVDREASLWRRLFGTPAAADHGTDVYRSIVMPIENATGTLLFDDPLRPLDRDSRETAAAAILAARDRGLTIVVASTEFESILAVCDRAGVLAGTELRQTGSPQELYENPGSRIVAAATGRCNLFPARRLSSSKADIPEFHTLDGGHRLFARSVERSALGAINQNVTLGIRPEHISISFGASFPEDNLLRATITGVRFLGPTTLVDLESSGLHLQALVLRLVGLNPGDECVVGLPIDKLHIFRD